MYMFMDHIIPITLCCKPAVFEDRPLCLLRLLTFSGRRWHDMGKRGRNHAPLTPFRIVRKPQVAPSSSSAPSAPPGTPSSTPARATSSSTSRAATSGTSTLHTMAADRPPLAPVVRHTARATPGDSPLDDSERERLLGNLLDDVRARSAQGPHASLIKTWHRLHTRWYGRAVPALPLTHGSIMAVAAQMKDAGYRSFPNYASALKDCHITEGHPWSDRLAAAVSHATASTQRGIGPPHQCGEITLDDALSVAIDTEPMVASGPADCRNMFVLAYFHVVRGMELVCANALDLTIDMVGLTESWSLSVSKTDPQAIGCKRTWGCTCTQVPGAHCPVHAAIAHVQWLRDRFAAPDGTLPGDLPLFPTSLGARASAERLNATVAEIASRLGRPLVDSMGRTAFTEHVFRVSGSRMLARRGVPVEVIMLLARWASEVIRRYIGEAPLDTLTTSFVAGSGPRTAIFPAAAPASPPVWCTDLSPTQPMQQPSGCAPSAAADACTITR